MTHATIPGLIVIYPTVSLVQESAVLSIFTLSGSTTVDLHPYLMSYIIF